MRDPLLVRRPTSSHARPGARPAVTDRSVVLANAADLVLPPPLTLLDAGAMEQLAGTLARLPAPVALEIAGTARERRLQVRGAPAARERVTTQLYGVYEQVAIQPIRTEDDIAAQFPARLTATDATLAARLVLAGPDFLPLRTWREFEQQDPLRAILAGMHGLGQGEAVLSQLIVYGSADKAWARPHLRMVKAQETRAPADGAGLAALAALGPIAIVGLLAGSLAWFGVAGLLLWAYFFSGSWWVVAPLGLALAVLGSWLLSLGTNPWQDALTDDAKTKLREQAFRCDLRVYVRARTHERARELLERMTSAYQTYNTTSGNQLRPEPLPGDVIPRDLQLSKGTKPTLLSVREQAGMWHMPVGASPERLRRQTYEQLLPLDEDVSDGDGVLVGASRKGAQQIPIWLSRKALERNLIAIGKTQQGKSTLMAHVAADLMRLNDRALVLIDPHGDLADLVLGLVPEERVGDVLALDLSDLTRSASLNVLDVSRGIEPYAAAELFMNVGKQLWQEYWGPRMSIPLQYALRALATANRYRDPSQQFTLLSVWDLLTCPPEEREGFLLSEVRVDREPGIVSYFLQQFANDSPYLRDQIIAPVLSKVRAFERAPATLRLVGQAQSSIDLNAAIRERKIVIVNVNSGQLGDDLAGFAGSLVLNFVRHAIAGQSDTWRELRTRVTVIVDEFQKFEGFSFGSALGELQKFGANFLLGTQSLDGLRAAFESPQAVGTVLAGVSTKVVFAVNGDDALYLTERELDQDRIRPESLQNLPPLSAYVKTLGPSGRPVPAFSIEVERVPEPDHDIAALVRRHQDRYCAGALEADQRVRESQMRFRDAVGDWRVSQDLTAAGLAPTGPVAATREVRSSDSAVPPVREAKAPDVSAIRERMRAALPKAGGEGGAVAERDVIQLARRLHAGRDADSAAGSGAAGSGAVGSAAPGSNAVLGRAAGSAA